MTVKDYVLLTLNIVILVANTAIFFYRLGKHSK